MYSVALSDGMAEWWRDWLWLAGDPGVSCLLDALSQCRSNINARR
jgi:hypothetical protein